uniref:Uncharacterized protein n=1 Tax=Pyrodinium bahamense TaxID=73915 RepID=A0A7S0B7Y3_9DINO
MQIVARSLAASCLVVATVVVGSDPDANLKAIDHVSEEGVQVLAGMAEAFLHRGSLNQTEVRCLLSCADNITTWAYGASADLASALGALLRPSGTMATAAAAAADLILVMPTLKARLGGLVALFGNFTGPCLGAAAQRALVVAGEHLGTLSYVTGHLRARGADIIHEMAAAYEAFGEGKFLDFGRGVGRACRKVLLANASASCESCLPEGPPSPAELVNLSAGLLQGFFGRGFELGITSDTRIATASTDAIAVRGFVFGTDATGTAHSDAVSPLNFSVDLHKCVQVNLRPFQSKVMGILQYFARQDLASESDIVQVLPAILTSTIKEAPVALGECGISVKQLEMIVAALEAFGAVRVQLKLPKSGIDVDPSGPIAQLQKAADSWNKMDWFALGRDIGTMLLQLVIQVFPQKYELDAAGALRERLAGLAGAPAAPPPAPRLLLLLAGAAIPPLLGGVAAVARTRRDIAAAARGGARAGDLEAILDATLE